VKDREYLEVNLTAGELIMLDAPKYNNVLHATAQNLNSRYENDFTFNMTTTQNIPKVGFFGAIWV
jgi:hypothetical protein